MNNNYYPGVTHASDRLTKNKPYTTSSITTSSIAAETEITTRMRNMVLWAVFLAGITALFLGGIPKISFAVMSKSVTLPFSYDFHVDGTLNETTDQISSSSPYWWVASGGSLIISSGTGKTTSGNLPASNPMNKLYAMKNPVATDLGIHPQNVFQMFLRQQELNPSVQVYVKENKDNLSNTQNRHPWNGVSLLARYVNDNTYYYAGIRSDGGVVIKKKVNGVYQTLAYKKIFSGTYDATKNPNLIPKGTWIGLRMDVSTSAAGNPKLSLYVDQGNAGVWQLATEAIDDPSIYGAPITATGLVGIQSDFADTEFDNFKLTTTTLVLGISAQLPAVPTIATTTTPTTSPVISTSNTRVLFADAFSQYADRLLTNEYAYWNPTNASSVKSSVWEMTSGSLFAQGGAGWTGVPNTVAPNALSTSGNNSAVFRLTTKRADFGNTVVEFDLLNQGLVSTGNTPAVDWDGVHVFLRYQSEESLYYASVNRRDNTVAIKKKVPGGTSNGGTYYNLSTFNAHPVSYGTWQHVKATVKNNTDGSVTIELFENGKLLARAIDNGSIGGAPIRNPGKVGIRGDNANIKFKNFTVTAL
ncbi:MAG: hypothetical protein Q7S11_02470 [bacterium]|nr:hypothetical protein [bacterium]